MSKDDVWDEEFEKDSSEKEALLKTGENVACFLGEHVKGNSDHAAHLLAFVGCMAVLARIQSAKKFHEEFILQFISMIHNFDPLIQLEAEMYLDKKKKKKRKRKKGEG